MNTWQKIAIGLLAAAVWIGTIVAGYFYPNLAGPLAEVKFAAIGVLNSLGIYHMITLTPPKVVPLPEVVATAIASSPPLNATVLGDTP